AVREGRLAVHRGHEFSAEDHWRGRMIEALMCDFAVDADEMAQRFALSPNDLHQIFAPIAARFGDMVQILPDGGLIIPDHARPLTRMIARMIDAYDMAENSHSGAI
ncbi:MAG: coproporphyrinogen III oxidase, partial [Paracoccus sp. (in: a-proteobacteria)]|nr:coproporphyrinogen III oxidase [Paracoccus sp. (in: a-proteobacteria)]